jgi:hypothetical protein
MAWIWDLSVALAFTRMGDSIYSADQTCQPTINMLAVTTILVVAINGGGAL